ncbi:PASTA domain-containing protein [Streptomyces sp. NPDC093085]|uniref:PASTA domain-containing protein n=1 Tax=Streptomyces sp. NPDC093085 TaxID=3155068 RepID=UPI0034397D25
MRTRIGIAALACAAACALAGCQPDGTDSRGPAVEAPSTEATGGAAGGTTGGAAGGTAGAVTGSTGSGTAEPVVVPDFVGMGLQSAQDAARAKGFHHLKSHDSSGRARLQAFDRHWKVCGQNVKAGTAVPVGTTLDFGTVKVAEECPAADEKEPKVTGGKMPDLNGASVKAARAALDPSTSLRVTDADGGRMVLLESNWRVCTQDPAPGVSLRGQPVLLTAVKYGENCP